MPFLSPAKVLVILVVALVVLGPDKLPKMAKQIGGLWGDFRKFRERLESDVRGSFPDLPSTEKISQAVRSPLSFLDTLADSHSGEQPAPSGSANGSEQPGVHGDPSGAPTDPTDPTRPADAPGRPTLVPGDLIPDAGGIVHQVRSTGGVVPDDPGLN
ncbi:MAG TPA: twin-arginine translocase TatA/TatE family subunit [Acidimicrobiales bacterium]